MGQGGGVSSLTIPPDGGRDGWERPVEYDGCEPMLRGPIQEVCLHYCWPCHAPAAAGAATRCPNRAWWQCFCSPTRMTRRISRGSNEGSVGYVVSYESTGLLPTCTLPAAVTGAVSRQGCRLRTN
jgi:hypothetical protein